MSWNTKTSKIYPLRIKNSQRYKAQVVANSKGRNKRLGRLCKRIWTRGN